MSNELDAGIVQQLLRLPYDQRDQLANTLIKSLHPPGEEITDNEWQQAWLDECHHRLAEIERGDVEMISSDELVDRLRKKHGE